MLSAAQVVITVGLILGVGSVAYAGGDWQTIPSRYDKPYRNVVVLNLLPRVVARVCSDTAITGKADYRIAACANPPRKPGGLCVIFLPLGANKGSYLYRHEQAHCNGWSGTHPP